ncbi:MAG: response regulator SirA [Anaerolineales bacterium]|nr:response regulator SirA [Chloroflexota bacterium]MBL6983597.1 response regulator SirA [Anaerolineales bacterium]
MSKITHVVKRSHAIVPFVPDRITNAIYRAAVSVGGRDRQIAEGLSEQVIKLLEENCAPGENPHIEEIQDLVEKVLIENGHAKVAKHYILYRDERTRRRAESADRRSKPSGNIPWAKIWYVLNWAVEHKVNTIENINNRIAAGEFPDIVNESESAYLIDVQNVTEKVAERGQELKMVVITGPSSSGKTTTTIKLSMGLEQKGFKLVTLNVDNYFFDLEMHPKDEFGDYDFETPQALDLPLINDHLVKLIHGEEIKIPFYDFKTGQRTENVTPMKLGENEIILIDSLHGLFPDMTQAISSEQKFFLYLEPLLQMKDRFGEFIRWTDIRLIRRMLRDASHRAYDPRETLTHWHYVRASEMRNIIPYINTADYLINTAMPYELCLYSHRLLDSFAEWSREFQDDPLREDALMRAERVYDVLSQVTPVADDSAVPMDSVLREFIGGSIYKY